MNIESSVSNYEASYKKKKTAIFFAYLSLLFVCILRSLALLKHGYHYSLESVFWPCLLISYIFIIADFILTKTTYTVSGKQLMVARRGLFYNKLKVYEIGQMQDLEVEQVMIKNRTVPSDEYIVTFFYAEKEIALKSQMAQAEATHLFNAIQAAKA